VPIAGSPSCRRSINRARRARCFSLASRAIPVGPGSIGERIQTKRPDTPVPSRRLVFHERTLLRGRGAGRSRLGSGSRSRAGALLVVMLLHLRRTGGRVSSRSGRSAGLGSHQCGSRKQHGGQRRGHQGFHNVSFSLGHSALTPMDARVLTQVHEVMFLNPFV
jgi:hypothetical protein